MRWVNICIVLVYSSNIVSCLQIALSQPSCMLRERMHKYGHIATIQMHAIYEYIYTTHFEINSNMNMRTPPSNQLKWLVWLCMCVWMNADSMLIKEQSTVPARILSLSLSVFHFHIVITLGYTLYVNEIRL